MRGLLLITVLVLFLASCSPSATEQTEVVPPPHASLSYKGISFSHEVRGQSGYGSESAGREIAKIRALGADSIALVPYAFTRAPQDTVLRTRTDETDERVMGSIAQAERAGLRVLLKPHVWGRGFTGDIQFASDRDFDAWWSQYQSWILHFAELAENHHVEMLAIGNELGGMTVHEQAWRGLIRGVRRVYKGKITYASHWDREFERITFWDELDFIGVNAYFPLASEGEMPRSDSSRIEGITSRLASIAKRYGRPVLFTEVGYASIASAAVEPWADGDGTSDLEMQAHCYQVMFESFARQPWFAGMFWWKWPSDGRSDPGDLSHRPNEKPAMEVLRRWFHAPAASNQAAQ